MDVLGSREGSCQGRREDDGGGKESSRPHCGRSRMTELMVGFKQLELWEVLADFLGEGGSDCSE